jgi:Carboxypeptidase regulatory-like domain/TonB-dependent Receptor Plug Domain
MLVACLVGVACELFSQAGVASISGLITDPSGAVVPGVQVTAVNQATQLSRTTASDNSGYYTFTSLPIGKYNISVKQVGFDNRQAILSLDPSEKARQDFQLTVTGTSSNVEVTSVAPEISRDDASIGTVVGNETIINTPLFMRNWDDLIRLVPGVQAQRYTEQSGGTASGRTGSFNIHGIDSLQNNFILDGIDNNTFSENVQELSTQAARHRWM